MLFINRADLELRSVRPHEGSQQLDRVVPVYLVLQRIHIAVAVLYSYTCSWIVWYLYFVYKYGTDIDASINAPCKAAPDEEVGGLEQVQQHLPADGSMGVSTEYPASTLRARVQCPVRPLQCPTRMKEYPVSTPIDRVLRESTYDHKADGALSRVFEGYSRGTLASTGWGRPESTCAESRTAARCGRRRRAARAAPALLSGYSRVLLLLLLLLRVLEGVLSVMLVGVLTGTRMGTQ